MGRVVAKGWKSTRRRTFDVVSIALSQRLLDPGFPVLTKVEQLFHFGRSTGIDR